MKHSCLLVLFLLIACIKTNAQIPYDILVDSMRMREMHEKKIMVDYIISVPFDSVTGKLKKELAADTNYTRYDREGRELEFRYVNDEDKEWHVYKFYDAQGRVVRKLSCNSDSTDGFVEYWEYNRNSQVVSQKSCERQGSSENPFKKIEFLYDDNGVLSSHIEYFTLTGKLNETVHYYYSGGYEVRVCLSANGDTSYVDSSRIHSVAAREGNYDVRYNYVKSRNGHYSRTLVSKYTSTYEDLGSRKKCTMVSSCYNYRTGELELQSTDTTYDDRNGKLIESRRSDGYTKYFWDSDGSLDYFINYNRQNQPLEKVTESFRYYN